MEKNIILISAERDVFINNTHTHFQNQLQDHNYLKPEISYAISPKLLSIDLQFENPAVSERPDYPELIICPMTRIKKIWACMHDNEVIESMPKFGFEIKSEYHNEKTNNYRWWKYDESARKHEPVKDADVNFSIEGFYSKHKFYLKRKKQYNISQIYQEWKSRENMLNRDQSTHGIKLNNNGNLVFGHIEKEPDDKFMLLFHENFIDSANDDKFVEANTTDRKYIFDGHIKIDTEKYFFYVPAVYRSGIVMDINHEGFYFKTPQLIKIICKNIENVISNNTFSKMIGLVSINSDQLHKHFHHTFKGHEYFPLQNRIGNVFDILLLDENNEKIRIVEGFPTLLELKVKEIMEEERPVRVGSNDNQFFDNTPTNFKVYLSESLNLTNEYKCAVTSITYRNNFKCDESFEFYFTCLKIGTKEEIVSTTKIMVGLNSKNAEEVFEDFKQKMNNLEVINTLSLKDETTEEANDDNGLIYMLFNTQVVLSFSHHLALLLGIMKNFIKDERKMEIIFEYGVDVEVKEEKLQNLEETNKKIAELQKSNDVIIKVGNRGYGGRYTGTRPVDKQYKIKQEFIFLLGNFIKNVCVGNGLGKVLKTVSIPKNSSNELVTVNFDNLDYHPLQYYNFQTLGFTLVSVTGNQLMMQNHSTNKNFDETQIHLIFKRFPKNDTVQ